VAANPDPLVRRAVAFALGFYKDDTGLDILRSLSKD